MEDGKLLALAAALVYSVRYQVHSSDNIHALYTTKMQTRHQQKISNAIRDMRSKSTSHIDNALHSLQTRVGNCGELCNITLLLASHVDKNSLNISLDNQIYISKIETAQHAFCILHQSQNLASLQYKDFITNDLESLSQQKDLKNAVIIDPWIYKATKLSDYLKHIQHAKNFIADGYFNGQITSCGITNEITNTPEQLRINELQTVLDKFYLIYNTEYRFLTTGDNSNPFEQGRYLDEVQKTLDDNITLLNEMAIKEINQLEPFKSLTIDLWKITSDSSEESITKRNTVLDKLLNYHDAQSVFIKILEQSPYFFSELLKWIKDDQHKQLAINAFRAKNNHNSILLSIATSSPELLPTIFSFSNYVGQKFIMLQSIFITGFSISNFLWFNNEARNQLMNLFSEIDQATPILLKNLNCIDRDGWSGWMQIALQAPQHLNDFLQFVKTDEQKNNIINALCCINNNGWSGWMQIAQSTPEALETILGWVKDNNQKQEIINSLCYINDYFVNGFNQIATSAPKLLPMLLAWAEQTQQQHQIIETMIKLNNNYDSNLQKFAQFAPNQLVYFLNLAKDETQKAAIFDALFPYGYQNDTWQNIPKEAQNKLLEFGIYITPQDQFKQFNDDRLKNNTNQNKQESPKQPMLAQESKDNCAQSYPQSR